MKFNHPSPLVTFGGGAAPMLTMSHLPPTPTPTLEVSTTPLIGQGDAGDPCTRSPVASHRIMSDGQQIAVHRQLLTLIESTGWQMVQNNGQRRFGPPRNWNRPVPGRGCEVFIGRIPRDMFEDELYPIFLRAGQLYEMRLMMDFSGTNRGFAFAKYATPQEADRAVAMLNGVEVRDSRHIRGSRHLGVVKSVDNRRLFVGGLPKDKTQEDVKRELSRLVSGIVDVILYSSVVDKSKNRGFAFVEFESHRVAAIARRRLIPGGVVLWDHDLAVDWAEPEPEVPLEVMEKVRVLYMRNLMLSTSEDQIRALVETAVPPHCIEKVKKLKDFAFLHFTDRKFAEEALTRLDGKELDGSVLTVVWAKPPELVQKKNIECSATEPIRANDFGGKLMCRGAGGLKPCLPSKMSHEGNFALVGPDNHFPYAFAMSHPYTSMSSYVSNYQALLSFCREYSLDTPRIELLETTFPGREKLVHFARVTLPSLNPPNDVVTGQLCETSWDAQESAAGLALRLLYVVYVTPPQFPAGPAVIPPPVIVSPNPYVCSGTE